MCACCNLKYLNTIALYGTHYNYNTTNYIQSNINIYKLLTYTHVRSKRNLKKGKRERVCVCVTPCPYDILQMISTRCRGRCGTKRLSRLLFFLTPGPRPGGPCQRNDDAVAGNALLGRDALAVETRNLSALVIPL